MAAIKIVLYLSFLAQVSVHSDASDRPERWKSNSVIYGEVTSLDKSSSHLYAVHIKPIATLTGRIDSGLAGEISPRLQVGFHAGSQIDQPPKVGSKILVYIAANDPENCAIPKDHVVFMPGGKGVVEVTGFDDPKVSETIENLRKLRAKQREDAEKDPAAKGKP